MIQNTAIVEASDRLSDELIEVRRAIHQNPELAFEEVETAKLVADRLAAAGIEHETAVGKTGVVALVRGTAPGDGGRTIAVRGDMDALPMDEQSDLPFASRHPGRAHTCGHDVHTAVALGCALTLHELRDQFAGAVKVLFQPAEETLGGARAMMQDGVLHDPEVAHIVGFHVWPALDAGTVGYCEGVVMASADLFDLTLTGVSGHGAHPHQTVDAISAAAYFITQLQTIVSREIAPNLPAVVTIGRIEGGTAHNQLPDEVHMWGSVRTQDEDARATVKTAMERLLVGIGVGMRVRHDLRFIDGCPVLRNDDATMAVVAQAARDILGADNVERLPHPSMGSEDFAEFAAVVPSAHLRLGCKIDGLETMIHRSNFDANERAIGVGVQALTRAAADLLG